jgi:leucyl aminopeptidase
LADSAAPAGIAADAVVLPLAGEWAEGALVRSLVAAHGGSVRERLEAVADPDREPKVLGLPGGSTSGPDWVVGVAVDPDLPPATSYRRAGIAAAAALEGIGTLAIVGPGGEGSRARAARLIEGVGLGRWKPGGTLAPPPPDVPLAAEPEIAGAWRLGRAVNWARTLVDCPSSELTPARLAEVGAEMAGGLGISHRIWTEDELREGGFGGILGVGRGAVNRPCMLELRYGPESARPLTLIGKGVTCDTGGLQIKISDHEWLLADMAGAAAVLAATWSAAVAELPIALRVLVPCVENMPTATAYRTGDVITQRDGSTTEIRHTDAEGRLILADAISLAREEDPTAIVTVSTLTDESALGTELWALLGNDDDLATGLLAAAARAGDPGWRLPLWPGYRDALETPRAARANIGQVGAIGAAGTILGGLFLAPFAGSVPLAHLDIAGTAYRTRAGSLPAGPTGSSTAALFQFLDAEARR